MKREEKDLSGKVIPIPEDKQNYIITLSDSINANKATIDSLSQMIRNKHKDLWKAINSALPEVKDYNATYLHDTKEVRLNFKNED